MHKLRISITDRKALSVYFTGKLNLVFFHLNPEVLAKLLFNLIYYRYLILTPALTPEHLS